MQFSFVYNITNKRNGTLYTGVTSDLVPRVSQHKTGAVPGFTSQYRLKVLVWYEVQDNIEQAIRREKRIKRWRRVWKLALIEANNPDWRDLWDDLVSVEPGPLTHLGPGSSPPDLIRGLRPG